MRLAAQALALALACACGAAAAQGTTQKKPRARVDDSRSRALLEEAQGDLQKGDYPAAEAASLRLLQENVRTFGPDHPNVAVALNLLGAAHFRQGKFSEAEGDFRRMLTIEEKRRGRDHEDTAAALNSLGLVLEKLGDYAGAETLLRRAVAILEKKLGKENPNTAIVVSNLARVLDEQGKFAATVTEKAAGAAPGTPEAAKLASAAQEAIAHGEYGKAETLQDQALAIHLKTLGRESATTANSMSNLAYVYTLQGRYADAEKLYRDALGIRERVLGPDHPDVATNLNNLAKVLEELGKDQQITASEARARARTGALVGASTEVEGMYRRALAIQERALGKDHPDTANTMNNLGNLLALRGDYVQAEQMERSALAITEKVYGGQHDATANVLTALSQALDREGKIVEAEASYRRAIDISRKTGNPRTLLINTSSLGFALAKRGRLREALPFFEESLQTLDFLYAQTRGYSEETRQTFLSQFSSIYRETIRLLIKLNADHPGAGYDREALSVASRNQSRIFTEMMRQADVARFQGDPAFVGLRDERTREQARLAQLRQARATVPVSLADAAERVAEFDRDIAEASRQLEATEQRLWSDYPRFMELATPRPVTVDELQKRLLKPGEALLSYVLLPQETVIFAVTQDSFRMAVTPVRRSALAGRVHRIRGAIDKVAAGESVLFLRDIDPATLASLYRDLVAPVAAVLGTREKVLVVADGPLLTVPFEMFLTEYTDAERAAFQSAQDASDGSAEHPYLAEYAGLSYLSRSHRFAYLPSLSALASQRLYPKRAASSKVELVAFADPLFSPDGTHRMSPQTVEALGRLNVAFKTANGVPAVPPLVETAEEAKGIASVLGGATELYIGDQAQEHEAKIDPALRSARYVLFATHGFLGGEYVASDQPLEDGEAPRAVAAKSQPALALTLVGDLHGEDGLLTMKEVIEDLELNADLVALSACNTAGESAEANNGEGFAGLTRAFMYAGAKSLLVSHWSVDSLSTEALMTSTFRHIKEGMPSLAAVNAARGEVLAGRYTRGQYTFSRAHPFFWAAFVYVGD